jgi:glutamate-ammonia-ligase adenylyltransferase
MTDTGLNQQTQDEMKQVWDHDKASANMERWMAVCRKEGWGKYPDNISLLARVFGASWYFTRFVFFRGREIARYIDEPALEVFSLDFLKNSLLSVTVEGDLEESMESLRVCKNEFMFRILLNWLSGQFNQEQTEQALTNLAEATLSTTMQNLAREYHYSGEEIVILGMGRMAGNEMNFGSDLDLIFLYPGKVEGAPAGMIKQIQLLLRHIALPSPNGILYEIDMRLRPHGTSGTLISPAPYFIEYHTGEREVWERQMMTRCRPIIDDANGLGEQSLSAISAAIYQEYDAMHLGSEIIQMRQRVEKELGTPKGKYEIKRGPGGIMDIDFITHYLQLLHGSEHIDLRTPSTRKALRKLAEVGIITDKHSHDLLFAYNFLKRIENCLRIMELKNISAFSQNPDDVHTLARAMDYLDDNVDMAAEKFLARYNQITQNVRSHFNHLVGEIT